MADCDDTVSISDLGTVSPVTPEFQGCQIFDKLRYVEFMQGTDAVINWQLRSAASQGRVVSLASTDSMSATPGYDVRVRVLECDGGCSGCGGIPEVTAEIVDESCGQLQFQLPDCIATSAGIYQLHVGVFVDEAATRPIITDKGLLSVERTAWNDSPQTNAGPPTIGEIRTMLRDTAVENVRLAAVEYTTDEIIQAIIQPIREWNESPPPVGRHSCRSFPYKFHWMRAIVAELMRIAAQHYLRNKMQMSGGGISLNDMDRNDEYMKLSELYRQEWRTFMEHEKVQINVANAYGTVNSPYASRYMTNW